MTDITELAQNPTRYGTNSQGVFTNQTDGEYVSYLDFVALVEALEKAQQRITQMESRTVTDWIEHDGKWRPESLGLDELVYLKTRKQELKIPYPAGKVKGWMSTGGDMDVMAYKLASPQASTVTVKLPSRVDSSNVPFAGLAWNCCLDEVERLLAAAGIKVEAE